MKLNHTILKLGFALLALCFGLVSCSDDKGIDNREQEYGYVQFKLMKQNTTRDMSQLEHLRDAHKVVLTLKNNKEEEFTQALLVEETSPEMAEFGMNTETIKLLTGKYELVRYEIYNAVDESIYMDAPTEKTTIEVLPSQLTQQIIEVKVRQRGQLRFKFTKELPSTRNSETAPKSYTFDEVEYISLSLVNTNTWREVAPKQIKCKFVMDNANGTSYLKCDTLIEVLAGPYQLNEYTLFNHTKSRLDSRNTSTEEKYKYEVKDNEINELDIKIKIDGEADYIKDYRILKTIWEKMDGKNWAWVGDAAPMGSNWNFDKDIDLWGDQPGIMLHPNGRVASLNLGGFVRLDANVSVPEEIGDLTELTQLWIGSHSDYSRKSESGEIFRNSYYSTWARVAKGESIAQFRYKLAKEEMEVRHRKTNQWGEIALSVPSMQGKTTYHNRPTYNHYAQLPAQTYDQIQIGEVGNGISGALPKSIGKLSKLEALYIANGKITSIPEEIKNCKVLTDLEIYNCNSMTEFPDAIAELPELTLINISGNKSIPATEFQRGLSVLFDGKSKDKIQILYLTDNDLKELPENAKNLKHLGLLDMAYNKLEKIHAFGQDVSLVEVHLDFNRLEELPANFCKMDDCEILSVSNNKLKTLPNIFTSHTPYYVGTIDLSYNQISKIEGYDEVSRTLDASKPFNGINATMLKLEGNLFEGGFPLAFSLSKSDIANYDFSYNRLDSIGGDGLKGLNFTQTLNLAMNKISEVPANTKDFNLGLEMPYLEGVDLSINRFTEVPVDLFAPQGIANFFFSSQLAPMKNNPKVTYRCMTKWPEGIEKYKSLRELRLDGNDIRKVVNFPILLNILLIQDNENISIEIPEMICEQIVNGTFSLGFETTQKGITGCAPLGIGQ